MARTATQTRPSAVHAAGRRQYRHRQELAALRAAVVRVVGTVNGSRNATLNAETFSLARFIGSGALSPREIADPMAHAGIAAGLDVAEVAAVSDRGHKSCTDNNVSSHHYLRLAQRHGIAPSIKVTAASPKF
jgi:hypothetical protein